MQHAQHPPLAYQQGAPQQQTTAIHQQPVVVLHQDTNRMAQSQPRSRKWCWKGLQITGYLQVILGVLAVLFGVISIIVRTYLFMVGTPIWCGICFFVVTGILGIAAGGKQRTGLIVGYMVMSILSSVAAACVTGFGGGVIGLDLFLCPDGWFGYRNYNSYGCSTSSSVRVGIDVCLLLIGLAEFVIAIVGASFTCVSLSENRKSNPWNSVTYQANRQQMVMGAPPQGVYYPPGTNVAYPGQYVMQPQTQFVMQSSPQYVVQPQTRYVVQSTQIYQGQPQGQLQPPPQGQNQPLPQGQIQPPQGQIQPPPQGQIQPPQGQIQPTQGQIQPPQGQTQPTQGQIQPPPQWQLQSPPQGQLQPPPQGQLQPPPQEQMQPRPDGQYPPQAQEQIHPEAPLSDKENLKQPLTI